MKRRIQHGQVKIDNAIYSAPAHLEGEEVTILFNDEQLPSYCHHDSGSGGRLTLQTKNGYDVKAKDVPLFLAGFMAAASEFESIEDKGCSCCSPRVDALPVSIAARLKVQKERLAKNEQQRKAYKKAIAVLDDIADQFDAAVTDLVLLLATPGNSVDIYRKHYAFQWEAIHQKIEQAKKDLKHHAEIAEGVLPGRPEGELKRPTGDGEQNNEH